MLDERRSAVLRVIVEEYVESAQPVGSGTVTEIAALGVSPATIRNDMAYLTQEGFVMQPHTSAGRVPSDTGYRHFVDHYASESLLSRGDRGAISRFFARAESDFERLLSETARLLARMSRLAAVVIAPQLEDSTPLSVNLTLLDARRLLVVLVTRTGRVAKMTISSETDLPIDRLGAANEELTRLVVGKSDWLQSPPASDVADPEVAEIVDLVLGMLAEARNSFAELFVGGAATVAAHFDMIDDVRDLLDFLDRRHEVIGLLEGVVDESAGDVQVCIGSELGTDDLRQAAMVATPYRFGSAYGVLALVGPTRMDYTQAMSTVAFVSGALEELTS